MNRLACLLPFFLAGCGAAGDHPVGTDVPASNSGLVTGERIVNADAEPGNWLSTGRTYDEQRFSPLTDINDGNVGGLGLAWYFDIDTNRAMEATPLVHDGVMYVSVPWSIVYALNAATGELIWTFDPKTPRSWGAYACCDVPNRGVALWNDKVYVATLDGYLVTFGMGDATPAVASLMSTTT
mgnify:CR=1 FL=1